jgi:predicted  nucleic acid-binding Zn-ribbon protein
VNAQKVKMKKNDQVTLVLKLHKLESDGNGIENSQAFHRLAKELDPSVLNRFRKIRARKGKGTAVLEDGVCSECNMLYPESHDVFRYRNFVHNCEYCGRLLVVTDKA